MFIVQNSFGKTAAVVGAAQYEIRKPALSACGAVPVIGAVPPAAVRQVSHPIEHAWDLRRYDESSKGATARQHNSGTGSLLPNREDADGVRRTEKTLVGCADPPSPLLRDRCTPSVSSSLRKTKCVGRVVTGHHIHGCPPAPSRTPWLHPSGLGAGVGKCGLGPMPPEVAPERELRPLFQICIYMIVFLESRITQQHFVPCSTRGRGTQVQGCRPKLGR